MTSRIIPIQLKNGLEARPVALMVQEASKYESKIYIQAGDKKINAKSIMGMMTLALANGASITVTADGTDELDAIAGIEKFLSGEE